MKRLITFLLTAAISLLLANPPEIVKFDEEYDLGGLGGNFILDMVSTKQDPTELYLATGSGISVAVGTNDPNLNNIAFLNRYVGHGGLSALSFSHDGQKLWATTAADTFITENGLNEFLQKGTGVHLSTDYGKSWKHFPQPGKTAIQGLTYDIACDSLGQLWLASFGQSLQVSPAGINQGNSWQVIIPESLKIGQMAKNWSPVQKPAHRLFAVHYTPSGKLWLGTAKGIFLSNQVHSLADTASYWTWQNSQYGAGRLTGNFVTSIQSDTTRGKERVWAATWSAGSASEKDGICMTSDNGKTWRRFLEGEKVYNFGFMNGRVFACAESGLWMADSNYVFEKYKLRVYSPMRQGYVEDEITKVYSFYYHGGKMWIGTGKGLLVSKDLGNTFTYFEAYQPEREKVYSYPNPFSPARFGNAKLYFAMQEPGNVNCTIYNFAMEKVCDVVKNASYTQGDHYLLWNGRDSYNNVAANGVYFFVIKKNGKELWNKILLFD